MIKQVDVAFSEGEDAGLCGTLEGMNPYQISDNDYHEWSEGWTKGNDQRLINIKKE